MRNLLPYLFLLLLSSCSQFSNGFLSRTWHNTNSRYNALLIAREDLDVAQEHLVKNYRENYEQVLPVFRPVDSTRLDTAKLFLVDAIKKASIIAEKHSNSKYLDEAYLLIGEARIYKGEFENAIETYKYLNTVAASEDKKTLSMVQMLRTYIELGDKKNAEQLVNLLRGRSYTKKMRATHLLTLAYYHQERGEDALTAAFLEEAMQYLKRGQEKARYHYLLAQLYDHLGEVILSRKNYNLVLKNKPGYDLVFHTELGLMGSESLGHNTALLYEKMLKDRKNQDLLHKVYFKMGETARKKRVSAEAISYFKQSIAHSGSDMVNKGMAYSAIADVYLDDLNDYGQAAMYYDSTVITLPREHLNRTDISDRSMYLNEYIKYKKVYELEDSLQRMAALSPEVLDKRLTDMVMAKRTSEKAVDVPVQTAPIARPTLSRKWRLYDSRNIVTEKNEFIRVWGSRKLEDNWRRTEKSNSTFVFNEEQKKMVEQAIAPSNAVTTSPAQVQNEANAIEEEIRELKKRIPTTKIQLIASKRKQEEAAFRIAKIYKLKFKDDARAEASFKQYLVDFPRSSYEPEVLYFLALAQADPLKNTYAERLSREYPNTSFGRQIRKGAVVMTQDREMAAQTLYKEAYSLYEKGQLKEVLTVLEAGMNEYVGSQLEDKMALLRIFALAKVGSRDEYYIALSDFVRSYPTSDLLPKAREMLAILN